MTRIFRIAALAALPVLVAPTIDARISAQEPITLEEAVERALRRHPQIAQSRQGLTTAETGQRTALGSFLPSVSASLGSSLRSADRFDPATDRVVSGSSDSYSAGLSGQITVFDGGRRFAEMREARAGVTAATASLADQRWAVKLQTEQLFYGALREEELLDAARANLRQAEESLDLTRRQAQVGAATTSDTLRTRLDWLNAEQEVLEGETALRAARMALARQVGEPVPVVPAAPEDLDPEPLELDVETVLGMAEEQAPPFTAARAASGAAEAAVSAARSAWLPSVNLGSGYNWANQSASLDDGTTSWSLNLSMSYPIFNGFQREVGVTRARESLEVARIREEDARLAAREEADAAYQRLRTAERAAEIAQEALQVAEEDLRVVRERYRLGVATVLDVLTSQTALDRARVSLVNARFDHILARSELEAVLGTEL